LLQNNRQMGGRLSITNREMVKNRTVGNYFRSHPCQSRQKWGTEPPAHGERKHQPQGRASDYNQPTKPKKKLLTAGAGQSELKGHQVHRLHLGGKNTPEPKMKKGRQIPKMSQYLERGKKNTKKKNTFLTLLPDPLP